jgi:xanthine dehydrogenase large subunit
VFFALRDAVASVADDRVNPPLNAPATAEQILKAVERVKTHPAVHPPAGTGPSDAG